jgi:cytochrome P450
VKATAGTIFFAGADTTVAALSTFILAMLANPEAQRTAQAEIDSVTEQTRLPTFEDRDSLPYIAALIKEVHRWEPVAPFGGCPASYNDISLMLCLLTTGSTPSPLDNRRRMSRIQAPRGFDHLAQRLVGSIIFARLYSQY